MTAAERGRNSFRVPDALDQHVDAVAAPEQFAVEHHGGHAEDAERFRLQDDAVVFFTRRTLHIGLESGGRSAELSNDSDDLRQFVKLEFVIPEALENRVMVSTKDPVTLGEQHAGA